MRSPEPAVPTLAQLRARPHTSVSRVRTFLACPRRYRLQYVERVEPAFRAAALALGSAWHEAVGTWLLGNPTTDELVECLRDALRRQFDHAGPPVLFDDEDQSEDGFIDQATKMLTVFVSVVAKPRTVLGVEVPFALELVDPDSGEVLSVPIIGAMDAIVDEDGPSVWELKTAGRRWSADQLEYDVQMTLYGRAARLEGYLGARLKLLVTTKATTPAIQIADVERSRADEAELVDLFFSVERAVAAGVDHRIRGWQCRSCAYASACR